MNEFSDQSTSKKKYSPEIKKKNKDKLAISCKWQLSWTLITIWDPRIYLGPPGFICDPLEYFGPPGTFLDPRDLLCNIHCIEINLIYTYLFIYK